MDIVCLSGGVLGTNSYIISLDKSRCFVVDPACSADIIAKRATQLGLDIRFILLTHGHYDHLESLGALKSLYPKADVLIHEKDSHLLGKDALVRHDKDFRASGLADLYEEFRQGLLSSYDLPIASRFLRDNDSFEDSWKIIHTPGHSPGSVCLYNKGENILISGDTLFYQGWGRTDFAGGDTDSLMKSLEKIYKLPKDTVVYPGHGKYGFTLQQNPIF